MGVRTVAPLFIFALLATPLAAHAQIPQRVIRIGWLTADPRPPDIGEYVPRFRRELLALGYVEGRHYVLEYRFADGVARLPALATELILLPVDLIVANSTPAALAAKGGSTTVPIVFGISADPVVRGLVNSFARPGGNVTGFTGGLFYDKWLEVLKEAVPRMSRAGVLCDCPSPQRQQDSITSAQARRVGVRIHYVHVEDSTELAHALASTANAGVRGLVVTDFSWIAPVHFKQIAEFTTTHGLPAIGPRKSFTEAGGLLSYGAKSEQGSARVAALVDRILKGAKPATLPVERPTLYELVINLKTAKAIGLTIPLSVLLRADTIIE